MYKIGKYFEKGHVTACNIYIYIYIYLYQQMD